MRMTAAAALWVTPAERGGHAWRQAAVQFCRPRLAPVFSPRRAQVPAKQGGQRHPRTPAHPARLWRPEPEERRGAEHGFETRRATTSRETARGRGQSRSAFAARASRDVCAFRFKATAPHREARRGSNVVSGLRGLLRGTVAVGDRPMPEHPATRAPSVMPSRNKHAHRPRRAANMERAMPLQK